MLWIRTEQVQSHGLRHRVTVAVNRLVSLVLHVLLTQKDLHLLLHLFNSLTIPK